MVQEITDLDVVYLASVKLDLSLVKEHLGLSQDNELQYETVRLKSGVNKVGRAKDNDIVINHPMVSAYHAEIIKKDGKLEIVDKNSTNGLFVNGSRTLKAFIKYEDNISLGLVPLKLATENKKSTFRESQGIYIDKVTFEVKEKTTYKNILDDISLTVYPSEFVGLIGPSGSGKTTLLNLMNGYVAPSEGNIFINRIDLHQHQNLFKGLIGFVPQDDIIHRELTVFESLYYSAKLRLPSDTSEDEIIKRVDYIVDRIELTKVKSVLIGSPEKKGISGGQRKRVNLAQELLTQPSILFLDEPTSGLDPRSDYKIMELLRELANEGRIIILTTHHITKDNFKLFDNIILLNRGGTLAFYGPSYPELLEFYQVEDPKYIFDKLEIQDSGKEDSLKFKQSNFYEDYVEKRKIKESAYDGMHSQSAFENKKSKTSSLRQFLLFSRRFFKIKVADKQNTLILLLQSPILALVIGYALNVNEPKDPFVFAQPVFIMIICAIFFGIINTSREIISERPIYFRERRVFLKIIPYLSSKISLLLFISLFQTVCLVSIIYYMCSLQGKFVNYLLTTYLISISSMSLGLLISTFAKTADSAISLSIFALIPQIIFSGAIVSFSQMKTFVEFVSYLCLSRWGYEALLIEEGTRRNLIDQMKEGIQGIHGPLITNSAHFENNIIILISWGILYLIMVSSILKFRDRKSN